MAISTTDQVHGINEVDDDDHEGEFLQMSRSRRRRAMPFRSLLSPDEFVGQQRRLECGKLIRAFLTSHNECNYQLFDSHLCAHRMAMGQSLSLSN